MRLNQLSVSELEKLFFKIYENACELLEDAELLYNHKKYARSYYCAHIAFEEFGKLPMLTTAALNVYNGVKNDWKYLDRRIRKHERKISQSWGTVMAFRKILENYESYSTSKIDENNSVACELDFIEKIKEFLDGDSLFDSNDFSKYIEELEVSEHSKETYSMTMLLKEYKNGSLYADFDNELFLKPSEKIDKETCEFGLINALIQKKFIEIPNIHKEGFSLYKFSDEHKIRIEAINNKYKEQIEKLNQK